MQLGNWTGLEDACAWAAERDVEGDRVDLFAAGDGFPEHELAVRDGRHVGDEEDGRGVLACQGNVQAVEQVGLVAVAQGSEA